MADHDWEAEYAGLLGERKELRRLIFDEFAIMSQRQAKGRAGRLGEIEERLCTVRKHCRRRADDV